MKRSDRLSLRQQHAEAHKHLAQVLTEYPPAKQALLGVLELEAQRSSTSLEEVDSEVEVRRLQGEVRALRALARRVETGVNEPQA